MSNSGHHILSVIGNGMNWRSPPVKSVSDQLFDKLPTGHLGKSLLGVYFNLEIGLTLEKH